MTETSRHLDISTSSMTEIRGPRFEDRDSRTEDRDSEVLRTDKKGRIIAIKKGIRFSTYPFKNFMIY